MVNESPLSNQEELGNLQHADGYEPRSQQPSDEEVEISINLGSDSSFGYDTNGEAERIPHDQNNIQIPPENLNLLPNRTVSVIPFPPRINVPALGLQPFGTLAPAATGYYFDTRMPYNYEYPNGFQNFVNRDLYHAYNSASVEQFSENLMNVNQNFGVYYVDLYDSQKRPFALTWVDNGVTYFQYYDDLAPVSY